MLITLFPSKGMVWEVVILFVCVIFSEVLGRRSHDLGGWRDYILSRRRSSSSSKVLGYWGWMNNFWYMEVCRWLPEVKVLLTIIEVMVVVSRVRKTMVAW